MGTPESAICQRSDHMDEREPRQGVHASIRGDNSMEARRCSRAPITQILTTMKKSTIHKTTLDSVTCSEWTETPPSEPGYYWLYGEDSYGSMGGHYTGSVPPEKRLHYVEVRAISNGLMAVTSGRVISLKKFDAEKRQEGHMGVWQPVDIPSLPD